MSSTPTPYNRQANFVTDAQGNPAITVAQVATKMDAEFNAVETALDETQARLAEVQRDDGALRNGVVSVEALAVAVLNLIASNGAVFRGSWATGTAYAVGQGVAQGGTLYYCLVAHTSGVFATDVAAGRWVALDVPAGSVTPLKLSTGGPSWTVGGILSAAGFSGPLTGNVTGNVSGTAGQLATARTIALAGPVTGSVAFNGASNVSIDTSFAQSPSFRNKIINGGMRIAQRFNGASFTTSAGGAGYSVDRWLVQGVGSSVTAQRMATSLNEFPFALRMTGATGNTRVLCAQRIESFNSADLVGGDVTVSFWASHSTAGQLWVYLQHANATDDFSSTTNINSIQTVSLTSTLTRYTVTFTNMPAGAANGIALLLSTVSSLGPTENVTITGVQLEAGSVATPFEHRGFHHELALCQRYFTKSYLFGVNPGSNVGAGMGGCYATFSSNFFVAAIPFAPMRAAPTMVLYDNAGNSGRFSYFNASWINNAVPNAFGALTDKSGYLQIGTLTNPNNMSFDYTASAEL